MTVIPVYQRASYALVLDSTAHGPMDEISHGDRHLRRLPVAGVPIGIG